MNSDTNDKPLTPEQIALATTNLTFFGGVELYSTRYDFYSAHHHPRQKVQLLYKGDRIATLSDAVVYQYEEALQQVYKKNPIHIFDLTHQEQAKLLGKDISQDSNPEIVVELDQYTSRCWYGSKFATVDISLEMGPNHGPMPELRLVMRSIDDVCLSLRWTVDNLYEHTHTTLMDIRYWLHRTGYYANVAGLKAFCKSLGKFHDNSNGV